MSRAKQQGAKRNPVARALRTHRPKIKPSAKEYNRASERQFQSQWPEAPELLAGVARTLSRGW